MNKKQKIYKDSKEAREAYEDETESLRRLCVSYADKIAQHVKRAGGLEHCAEVEAYVANPEFNPFQACVIDSW